jgi:Mrp family chromosome partitioning ATPase
MVTDAAVLSNRVDGTVLVIEASYTRRDAARQAIASLQQANARLLGAVLNRVAKKKGGYYYQGDYTAGRATPIYQPTRAKRRRRLQWLPFIK